MKIAAINAIFKIRSVPILSPKIPKRGAAINVAIPGIDATHPLMNVMLPTLCSNSRTYRLRIGLME